MRLPSSDGDIARAFASLQDELSTFSLQRQELDARCAAKLEEARRERMQWERQRQTEQEEWERRRQADQEEWRRQCQAKQHAWQAQRDAEEALWKLQREREALEWQARRQQRWQEEEALLQACPDMDVQRGAWSQLQPRWVDGRGASSASGPSSHLASLTGGSSGGPSSAATPASGGPAPPQCAPPPAVPVQAQVRCVLLAVLGMRRVLRHWAVALP